MTPAEHIVTWAERWAGPLGAWLAQLVLTAFAGMNLITGLGALAALWWTIERARTERAKRRAIEGYAAQDRHMLRRLMDRFRTRPAALDSRLDPPS